MSLLTLVDISVSAVWWVTKGVYYTGKYMIYGRQKTENEIIEEKIDEKLKQILNDRDKVITKRHSL
jgi:hypothetical protein